MSSRSRWLILALALVGLGLSAYSSFVHYRLLTDASYITSCDVNATFSCSQAYLSRYGSFLGVPVALGGLIWFGLVALIAGFSRTTEGTAASARPSVGAGYLFLISIVGLAVVLYLGYASIFMLRTGCLVCIATYVCVAGIFVLSSLTRSVPLGELPGRLSRDLQAVTQNPAVLMLTLLFAVGTVAAVMAFPGEGEAPAAEAAPAADAREAFARAWAQQPRVDLGIPADGAKVIVVKFNDYECPGCRQAEVIYKPVLEKFEASHPGAIKYVVKDWPWDAACNFHASSTIRGHEAACAAAAAARMAADRGKHDEMEDWLYANQGTTPAALREAAARILGVTDFDREYALKLPDIRRDIADGGVLGINSTPTYFINGVRLPADRMMPPNYFELAISLELETPAS